jgi:tRNA nucleotidyltransferase (CCA-adding enzyme)
MDLVLCHRTADFDVLGAAVGIACWQPGTQIVLTGGAHPGVQAFLSLYRDELPLLELRAVNPDQIRSLTIVDTQRRELLGKAAAWLDLPGVTIHLYDHHLEAESDIAAQRVQIEPVGATTTLIVEHLKPLLAEAPHLLSAAAATVMALGIHADTGSLTYENSTERDAQALAWLMAQGAHQRAIGEFSEPGLSPKLQTLLTQGLAQLKTSNDQGYQIGSVLLTTPDYTPGMSTLAAHLINLTETDCLLLGNLYRNHHHAQPRLAVIARARKPGINLHALLQPWGGGGHASAAALTIKTDDPQGVMAQLLEQLRQQLPPAVVARTIMSAPVRTIRPETTIDEARRTLLRYGHSGLSVVDTQGSLLGIISRRDLDIALHHGFGHAPVKGYMSAPVQTITPDTPLTAIATQMAQQDIGRLPVIAAGQLVGIVTRTDVLRQLYHPQQHPPHPTGIPGMSGKVALRSDAAMPVLQHRLQTYLPSQLRDLLQQLTARAAERGWQLYLVGGAVRDLWLAPSPEHYQAKEFDLVVDGVVDGLEFAPEGIAAEHLDNPTETPSLAPPSPPAGVLLAEAWQAAHPDVQLQVYGQFQTAALHWGSDSALPGFSVDIATARTEFYPYPAAYPEVSASSIRQDLYRRDFTINALAIRLTNHGDWGAGELLDFFGGISDLEQKQVRVLHPNSFIEDPTRIFRAVRFAVRLGFQLEPQTEAYIRHAVASGVYQHRPEQRKLPSLQSRLRNELKYLLQEDYWVPALQLLGDLGALQCLHPQLIPSPELWRRMRLTARWLAHLKTATDSLPSLTAWQMMLETLIAGLPAHLRQTVAANLNLAEEGQQRLQRLESSQKEVQEAILTAHAPNNAPQNFPSKIVQCLSRFEIPLLILVASQSNSQVRRILWRYLTHWRQVKPLLNGNQLQQLGYRPGPQLRQILAQVLAATLDGQITDETSAIDYVYRQFPVEN